MGVELDSLYNLVAGARAACVKTAYATLASSQFGRFGADSLCQPTYFLALRARVGGHVSFFGVSLA